MEKLLTEICTPKQWKTISTSKLLDEGYTVYGANGIIGYYDEYTHEEPTLMITCRGATCGTLNISKPFSYINGNAMALDNLDDDINIKYLYYYLTNRGLKDTISGSAQPQITRIGLANVKINYPNIETQNKIVEVLDKAQDLINKRKDQIESLDELTKSRFIEVFGNPLTNPKGFKKVKIRELIDIKVEKAKQIFNSEDLISYIDISCIDNISNKIIDNNKYNFKEAPSRAQQCIKIGDILISNVRPNLKNIAMVQYQLENMVTTSGVTILRSKNINKYFLFQYVLTDYFTDEMVSLTSGANYPAIKSSDIYNHEIINPPIELQNKFADYVNQVDKLKSQMETSLKELEDNFNSLMQKAFKGELF